MKIWTALIMIVTLAAVVAASVTIGALLGMLIAFLLGTSMSSAAPIGALGGGFAAFVFLMNAKENGGKGLFSLHKKIAQNGRLSPEAASGTAGRT